jgi:alpha-glucosidase
MMIALRSIVVDVAALGALGFVAVGCTGADRPATGGPGSTAGAGGTGNNGSGGNSTPSGGTSGATGSGGTSGRPGVDAGPSGPGGAGGAGGATNPPNPVGARGPWTINSPDGKVLVTVTLETAGSLSYALDYAGKNVIGKTAIAISTSPVNFSNGLQFTSGTTSVIQETYTLPTGKKSPYVNHANELTLKFSKTSQELDLVVRAYDEGGAYRFVLPSGGNHTVQSETGGFTIPAGTVGWAAPTASDYQGLWNSQTAAQINAGSFEMPVLLKEPDGTWAFVSEASVYSTYWGTTLRGRAGMLALQGGGTNIGVTAPFAAPWRVAMVGPNLSTIVESTMIENLNPPSEIGDASWVKAGRSAWSWWSGDSTSNYATQQRYVDLAASMGWEYYLCDAGWQASWMPMLVAYGASKGVDIWLWIDAANMNTDAKIAANIAQWSAWGIKGVKVDYLFGDSAAQLAVYDKIAVAAAQAHMMVNYHGCTKPAGERRRWPHLMTREAIYGAEQYKVNSGPTAQFNTIVPFTRNVQGPMDYTPVTYSNTMGKTTYAHQTALDVLFESGVQHLADRPATYTTSPGNLAQQFLKAVPASWDDTKLVEGDPGSFVTIARRSGTSWFVGAITDAARTTAMALTFLGPGTFTATIYRDGASDTEQVQEQQSVTSATVLAIPLRLHGGAAVQITPG